MELQGMKIPWLYCLKDLGTLPRTNLNFEKVKKKKKRRVWTRVFNPFRTNKKSK